MPTAVERLRAILTPDAHVYLILRHVSRSGMRHCISMMVFRTMHSAHLPFVLDGLVAEVLGRRTSGSHGGVVIDGTGMDMGYALASDVANVTGVPIEHHWL